MKRKIAFTAANILASWPIIWNLESGSVGLAFILSCILTMIDGAVLDLWEEIK